MRPSISVPEGVDPELRRSLKAIKENIEILTGRRNNPIEPIQTGAASTATLADVITKLNEVAAKVNELVDRVS